jgi:uncharacterized protein (TIGR03382 family)
MRMVSLAALLAPTVTLAQAPPSHTDHVVIVFDASGSMCGGMASSGVLEQKLVLAKRALKRVAQHIPPTTAVGLLVFNQDSAEQWTYPLGPRDDAQLHRAIEAIRCEGGTPLGNYMKIGADRLLEEREQRFGYGSYRLLVVTDGEATDTARMERYTPEIKSRGLTLDVIGVAMEQDHTLQRYAHSYRRADDPAALERAIREVLAERVDPRDRTGGGDAFAIIAGIDPAVAQEMVVALGKLPNHPIGAQPRAAAAGSAPADGGDRSVPPVASPPPSSGCGCATVPGDGVPSTLTLGMAAVWLLPRWRRHPRCRARRDSRG